MEHSLRGALDVLDLELTEGATYLAFADDLAVLTGIGAPSKRAIRTHSEVDGL